MGSSPILPTKTFYREPDVYGAFAGRLRPTWLPPAHGACRDYSPAHTLAACSITGSYAGGQGSDNVVLPAVIGENAPHSQCSAA